LLDKNTNNSNMAQPTTL